MIHWGWLIIAVFISATISVAATAILSINRDRRGYQRGYQRGYERGYQRGQTGTPEAE